MLRGNVYSTPSAEHLRPRIISPYRRQVAVDLSLVRRMCANVALLPTAFRNTRFNPGEFNLITTHRHKGLLGRRKNGKNSFFDQTNEVLDDETPPDNVGAQTDGRAPWTDTLSINSRKKGRRYRERGKRATEKSCVRSVRRRVAQRAGKETRTCNRDYTTDTDTVVDYIWLHTESSSSHGRQAEGREKARERDRS